MRYLTIPEAVQGLLFDAEKKPMPYPTEAFLQEFVWGSRIWKTDSGAVASQGRVMAALRSPKSGDVRGMIDEDHERLEKVVLEIDFPKHLNEPLHSFVAFVTSATSTPPVAKDTQHAQLPMSATNDVSS